jgi:hypothetical protein
MKYVQTFESFMQDAISEENTFFNENELSEELETLENEIAALESAADLLEDADAAKAAQKAQLKKMAAAKKAEMEKAKEARRDAMFAKRRAANDELAKKKPAYAGGRFGDNRFR